MIVEGYTMNGCEAIHIFKNPLSLSEDSIVHMKLLTMGYVPLQARTVPGSPKATLPAISNRLLFPFNPLF